MRRFSIMLLLCFALLLTGCGQKSEQEVLQDLAERKQEMNTYQSRGKMVIQTGKEPITYDVEVWYKKPYFYRVAVKNVQKDITQVLLRNHDGVYVLTPHLKKSFRFQSNWPESDGQVYLYQTLIKSILRDKSRKFRTSKHDYQFDVSVALPQHPSRSKQRIWLDHDLNPKRVQVLNDEHQVMIEVTFQQFQNRTSFDVDSFDMKRNMQQIGTEGDPKSAADAVAPAYLPAGSRLESERSLSSLNGPLTVMRYQGKHPFAITVRRTDTLHQEIAGNAVPINLQQALGVLTTKGKERSLSWIYQGNEYELLGKLSAAEMVKIANTTFQEPTK
ncbi:Outer membrane lipoprotein-sorting protein [Seinonella peptonophila]|uniref:Outer membrane lipoprotein-sorting protein n=1 Tax=Seinonella peptonophila TaxID=112248 RepID=A0A1M4YD08_9BACL|nr:outer membrane lipoprotein-sorting protein [Seinonella peptonophila]SHF03463.1 Outer membrane lipoprotein-sorting protein [Seinonella peptonophila]